MESAKTDVRSKIDIIREVNVNIDFSNPNKQKN